MIDQLTPNDVHSEIQYAIRLALARSGLSQTDLAQMTGVSRAAISNTLNRNQRATWRLSTIEQIFTALGYKMHLNLEKIDE